MTWLALLGNRQHDNHRQHAVRRIFQSLELLSPMFGKQIVYLHIAIERDFFMNVPQ